MTPRPDRIPFTRPARRDDNAIWHLARAIFAAKVRKCDLLDLICGNRAAELLWQWRNAAVPATLGDADWAASNALTAVYDTIVSLAPQSAIAALMAMSLRVDLTGFSSITLPAYACDPDDLGGGFIAEAAPIPVRVLSIADGVTLSPNKFAVISEFTNDLIEHSNAQRIMADAISRNAALKLDVEALSNTASSSIRPAGLLNGVTPIAATPARDGAWATDLGNLVGALSAAGGGTNPAFICSPAQATILRARVGSQFTAPILPSAALAAGTVVAVEATGFVSGFSPVPEIQVSDSATLHEEDTSPAELVGVGPVVASPIRSLWQTDSSALKLILRLAWGVRASGLVQTINSVNW